MNNSEKNVFPGEVTDWEGFELHTFNFDGREARVVVPEKALPGGPWVWRARFFGAWPEADLALLSKGFHLAYIDVANMFGSRKALRHWDNFYEYLTSEFNFPQKVVLEGFSRGGLPVYNWASENPEKVTCIYVDAPVCDIRSWPGGKGKGPGSPECWQLCMEAHGINESNANDFNQNPIDRLLSLAKAGIPLLHVCGDVDETVPIDENTYVLAERYRNLGGDIEIIIKKGVGHHPHSLNPPDKIVEFILRHSGI